MPWVLVFYGPQIRARSKFASVRSAIAGLGVVTDPDLGDNASTMNIAVVGSNNTRAPYSVLRSRYGRGRHRGAETKPNAEGSDKWRDWEGQWL